MMTILAGCGANRALFDAAGDIGTVNAGVSLADQPAGCSIDTPHAALRKGEEVRATLKRERAQLNVANGKRADCYLFNKVQIDGMRDRK